MTILVRTLIGLIALIFVAWGLRFIFTPEAMAAEFAITPSGVAGLSTIRGDLGGAFPAIGLFAAMGLRCAPRSRAIVVPADARLRSAVTQ